MSEESLEKFTNYLEETTKNEQSRRPLGQEMQCRYCIFWELEDWKGEKKLLDLKGDHADVWGECRRNAPRPSTDAMNKIGDLLGSIAWAVEEDANIEHSKMRAYDFEDEAREEVWFWPKTQPYSWCGEFKAGRRSMSEDDISRFEKLYDEWMSEDEEEKKTT